MSRMDFLRQGETPFDGFLYAAVGEDRGGNTVSVLSTLARLGLDPWDEAADLAELPRADARNRLERLLGRFGDVPALRQDHATIIARLIELLPKATSRPAGPGVVLPSAHEALGAGPVIAVLIIVLFVVQNLVFGSAIPGN
jgi:hypothetical protein